MTASERLKYQELHRWVRKNLGRATYCSNGLTHKSKIFDWANISGEYKRDLSDFKPLCRSCHIKMDWTEERLIMLKRNPYQKAIRQYSKIGEFIKEWKSSMEVERELRILHSSIANVLAGRAETAGGWRWAN